MLCYGDGTFETLVWLKKPLRAPDLPRRRILADCLSALRPTDELWTLYIQELQRLRESGDVSEEDFVLLKLSLEAKTALLEVTKNDPQAFGEGTLQEILRRSKAVVQGEATREVDALRGELQRVNDENATRKQQIADRSGALARWACRGLLWITLAVLLASTYLISPTNGLSRHLDHLIAPVILVAFVFLNVMTLASISVGATVRGVLQGGEMRLARGLTTLQYRIAGFLHE